MSSLNRRNVKMVNNLYKWLPKNRMKQIDWSLGRKWAIYGVFYNRLIIN